jgi:hypothetical protein
MMTLGQTWLEPEERAYYQSFGRKGNVKVRANEHAPDFPVELVGQYRRVSAGVADTFFSIPARLRYKSKRYAGFLSVVSDETELTFTPEASGSHCDRCRKNG